MHIKNLKTNKVIGIIREIGKQPLLAFGNSGGDKDMANYVLNKNKYPSMAFMVCCDDTVRERGNEKKLMKWKKTVIDLVGFQFQWEMIGKQYMAKMLEKNKVLK